jgi:LmbE family N-acetylglucosaminyl deacetylase
MVIISPHLDDAVFSCGQLMATHPGASVVTVFAGIPSKDAPLPPWDERCGFTSAHEAVKKRREEDKRAMAVLTARPLWLDFLDSQYERTPTVADLAQALSLALRPLDTSRVLLPLGLFHSDHLLTHAAALEALRLMGGRRRVHLYEDLPYRDREGLLQQRLSQLGGQGMVLTPVDEYMPSRHGLKDRAVAAYGSQLRALGDSVRSALGRAERIWEQAHGQ